MLSVNSDIFSNFKPYDITNTNFVDGFFIGKITDNYPHLSQDSKKDLLEFNYDYYLNSPFFDMHHPKEVYFYRINEKFMTPIKNFFFNMDQFSAYLHPDQLSFISFFSKDNFLDCTEDDWRSFIQVFFLLGHTPRA